MRTPLDVPGLPKGMTVTTELRNDDRITVVASFHCYGAAIADANEASIAQAVDAAVAMAKKHARWGRDIGDVVEVCPDVGNRVAFHGRSGLVIGYDALKREATVAWDDGGRESLPFAAFASDDMESAA